VTGQRRTHAGQHHGFPNVHCGARRRRGGAARGAGRRGQHGAHCSGAVSSRSACGCGCGCHAERADNDALLMRARVYAGRETARRCTWQHAGATWSACSCCWSAAPTWAPRTTCVERWARCMHAGAARTAELAPRLSLADADG
jgi:hypothetical protein